MSRAFVPPGGITAEPAARIESIECDALVVFLTAGGVGSGAVAAIDRASGGLLSRIATAGDLTGKRYELVPLLAPPGVRAAQVAVVGLGPRETVDAGVIFRAAATAARQLAGRPRARVAFAAEADWPAGHVEQAVAGAAAGMVGQDAYRAEKRRTPFGATIWVGAAPAAVATGATIAAGVDLARRPRPTTSTPSRSPTRPPPRPAPRASRSRSGTNSGSRGNGAGRSSPWAAGARGRPGWCCCGTAAAKAARPTPHPTSRSWARASRSTPAVCRSSRPTRCSR
jgi:hypothetical protein